MRGELLRMLMARRNAGGYDIDFDVVATEEQLTYQFAAKPLQQFEVEWGDGTSSYVAGGTATTPSHTYSSAGTYSIRILDAEGLFGASNYIKPGANNTSANNAYAAMVGTVRSWKNAGDYIWGYTFDKCANLTALAIPAGTTTVSDYAFRDCSSLALVELPSSITRVTGGAFLRCSGLLYVTFLGTPTSISATAFNNCTNLTDIYVPWSEGEVADAPWGATNATIHYNS